eukprot:Gb_37960 [translate_table: standard]
MEDLLVSSDCTVLAFASNCPAFTQDMRNC